MKMRWAFGIPIMLTILASTRVEAQDAPLGLVWGATSADVRKQGVELKDFSGSTFGKSFLATKVDRAVSDQGASLLSFGFNDRLWRILITSREFTNDPTGSAVLARYEELSSVLSEKYGKAREVHRLGSSIYSQPKYFVAGIRGGESVLYSNFETPTLSIQLGLIASDSSTSRWRLIYENKVLRKEFEASKRAREKGNL
jgi:hypothetical protein